ncbi:hypothetical protein GB937_006774 [Aspergillus fischeri]|nr:hypothetical protein GB937_006774 [Aspergillus fischeri]
MAWRSEKRRQLRELNRNEALKMVSNSWYSLSDEPMALGLRSSEAVLAEGHRALKKIPAISVTQERPNLRKSCRLRYTKKDRLEGYVGETAGIDIPDARYLHRPQSRRRDN